MTHKPLDFWHGLLAGLCLTTIWCICIVLLYGACHA